jgi:hypothetical protein
VTTGADKRDASQAGASRNNDDTPHSNQSSRNTGDGFRGNLPFHLGFLLLPLPGRSLLGRIAQLNYILSRLLGATLWLCTSDVIQNKKN